MTGRKELVADYKGDQHANSGYYLQRQTALVFNTEADYCSDTIADPGGQQYVQEYYIRKEPADEKPQDTEDYGCAQAGQNSLYIIHGGKLEDRQFLQVGTFTATGTDRCLHQTLRANRLAAFAASQIRFYIGMGSTAHLTYFLPDRLTRVFYQIIRY